MKPGKSRTVRFIAVKNFYKAENRIFPVFLKYALKTEERR